METILDAKKMLDELNGVVGRNNFTIPEWIVGLLSFAACLAQNTHYHRECAASMRQFAGELEKMVA